MFEKTTSLDEREKILENIEPAWSKVAHLFRTGNHYTHGNSICLQSLIDLKRRFDSIRTAFEAGDTMQLLYGIALCAEVNLPLPEWLALAYQKQFNSFLSVDGPVSLDEVFHSDDLPATPTRGRAARRDWAIGARLWKEVLKIRANHDGLDPALREVLAAGNFPVELTKARELVEEVDAVQCRAIPERETLSRFFEKRRKGIT